MTPHIIYLQCFLLQLAICLSSLFTDLLLTVYCASFYCVMELSKQVTGQAGQGGMKLDKAETGVKLGWAVLGESG